MSSLVPPGQPPNLVATCIPAYCNKETNKQELWFHEQRYVCKKPGKAEIDGYDGFLTCPDYDTFCKWFDKRCPMDCYGHGICLENTAGGTTKYECFCLNGYEGPDCNTCTKCKKETLQFVLCADTTPGATVPTCRSGLVVISLVVLGLFLVFNLA